MENKIGYCYYISKKTIKNNDLIIGCDFTPHFNKATPIFVGFVALPDVESNENGINPNTISLPES
jgi:hypothetical protein